jgi:hypothetical protein
MAQHDVRLAIGNPDQNPALCLIFRHRLTPSVSRPDPSAASSSEPGIQGDLDWVSTAEYGADHGNFRPQRPDRSDHRFESRHRTGEAQANFREEYGADQVFARTFDVTDELDVIEAVNWWVARSLAA